MTRSGIHPRRGITLPSHVGTVFLKSPTFILSQSPIVTNGLDGPHRWGSSQEPVLSFPSLQRPPRLAVKQRLYPIHEGHGVRGKKKITFGELEL